MAPSQTEPNDAHASDIDRARARRLAAIAKVRGASATTDSPTVPAKAQEDDTHEEPTDDGIHVADVLPGPVIDIEAGIAKRLLKAVGRTVEIEDDAKEAPREALEKWIRYKWPKASATPTGQLVLSQILFFAAIYAASEKSQKPPVKEEPAPIASTDTKRETATVDRVAFPSQNPQTPRPPVTMTAGL